VQVGHKPGSVPTAEVGDDHPSGTPVARRLERPDPGRGASNPGATCAPSLFGLAPGGVYLAGRSPGRRWALTPPFHRRRQALARPAAVSFLWHSPSGHPDWVLSSALLCGARTFLERRAARGRPADLPVESPPAPIGAKRRHGRLLGRLPTAPHRGPWPGWCRPWPIRRGPARVGCRGRVTAHLFALTRNSTAATVPGEVDQSGEKWGR